MIIEEIKAKSLIKKSNVDDYWWSEASLTERFATCHNRCHPGLWTRRPHCIPEWPFCHPLSDGCRPPQTVDWLRYLLFTGWRRDNRVFSTESVKKPCDYQGTKNIKSLNGEKQRKTKYKSCLRF